MFDGWQLEAAVTAGILLGSQGRASPCALAGLEGVQSADQVDAAVHPLRHSSHNLGEPGVGRDCTGCGGKRLAHPSATRGNRDPARRYSRRNRDGPRPEWREIPPEEGNEIIASRLHWGMAISPYLYASGLRRRATSPIRAAARFREKIRI